MAIESHAPRQTKSALTSVQVKKQCSALQLSTVKYVSKKLIWHIIKFCTQQRKAKMYQKSLQFG